MFSHKITISTDIVSKSKKSMRAVMMLLFGAFFIMSCQTYKPMSIEAKQVLNELEQLRSKKLTGDRFDFASAAKTMSQNNLELKVIEEKYKTNKAIAELKTPWPNPELEAGPSVGTNLDAKTASSTQPFVALSIVNHF